MATDSRETRPPLRVTLEIPYDEELYALLAWPDSRFDNVSLEIGFAGWPAKIVDDPRARREVLP